MRANAVVGLRARPKTTVVLGVLLLSVGLVLGLAREALALSSYEFRCTSISSSKCGSWPRDSDGSVPQSLGDLNPNAYGNTVTLGRTSMMFNSTNGIASIVYDHPAISYCNIQRAPVYDHEHAHARGWDHGEGPREFNDAYSPTVGTCRRS